jgi:hypothetical protein
MFDTDLYQQVLGLTTPWKVTDVKLDVESTEIHVHLEHADGCRWNCPHCSRELACYDHAPERQWRHLNTCQFHTLVHMPVFMGRVPGARSGTGQGAVGRAPRPLHATHGAVRDRRPPGLSDREGSLRDRRHQSGSSLARPRASRFPRAGPQAGHRHRPYRRR